jgi:hypothetical protein
VFVSVTYTISVRRVRLVNFLTIAIVVLIASSVAMFFWRQARKRSEERDRLTKDAVMSLVSEVEQLPRLPVDESELIGMRGKPLPINVWGTPVHYTRYVVTNTTTGDTTTNFIVATLGPLLIYRYNAGPKTFSKEPF